MHIDKDKAYLLAYGFVAERLGKLQAAATEGGVGIKLIRDENLDLLVRELLLKTDEKLPEIGGESASPDDKAAATLLDDKAAPESSGSKAVLTSADDKTPSTSTDTKEAAVSLEDQPRDSSPGLDLEFILFVNMGQDEIYAFLEVMQKKELAVPYKAGLTANNINWPLRALIAENRREHEFIKLYQGGKQALYFGADLYEKTQDEPLLQRLETLQQYIKEIEIGQETSEQEDLDQFEQLRKRYNALAMRINELLSGEGANA